jgi:hypothetical protein
VIGRLLDQTITILSDVDTAVGSAEDLTTLSTAVARGHGAALDALDGLDRAFARARGALDDPPGEVVIGVVALIDGAVVPGELHGFEVTLRGAAVGCGARVKLGKRIAGLFATTCDQTVQIAALPAIGFAVRRASGICFTVAERRNDQGCVRGIG